MAKDLYNGPLNKDMDFTDPIGTGAPASGLAVQNYIKEIDSNKYGAAFVDNENMCLFFATTEDMETYQADPTRTDLIKNSIEMSGEPKYKIVTDLTEPENGYAAVFYGSKGNYIRYTFQTLDRDNVRFPEGVDAVYTIQNGETITTVRESYSVGANVAFNIDNYLKEGNNDVAINLTGRISRVQKTVGVRFDVINLSLTDRFDMTPVYTNQDELVVSFNYSGSGIKYLEWYVDGNKLDYDASSDSYAASQGTGIKHISLSGKGSGRHNLQYRMYVEVNGGSRFYSNTLYRDFVIDDPVLESTVILTKFTIPQSVNIPINAFTQPIPLNGPTQYEEYIVEYSIFSKTNKNTYPISITLGSKTNIYDSRNRTQYEYSIKEFSPGTTALVFSCEGTTLSYNAVIERSDYNITPVTGQVFEFSGSDRTNDSDNRATWSYGDYTGTLSGFKWNENSGWSSDGKLVIPNGASFVTTYKPFINNIKTNGFTFEIEFETSRVLDEDAVILDLTNNGNGLKITASEITFKPDSNIILNTRYKPEENIRASIVVNPVNAEVNPAMMFIYIDGILTGARQYASNDSFIVNKALEFIGGSGAIMKVKQIVCYPKPLTHNEILTNFIIHRDTVEELVDAYDRNNVYIENTEVMSADKLAAATPVIIITCNENGDDTPDRVAMMQGWNETNKKTYVKMYKIEVINNADPTRNLTLINPSMRCQGTSSMAYPRKNFRFYTQADSKDETVPKYTTQMYDYQGREITGDQRLYSFKTGAQPVNCWCLKADYAESSSTHNTGVARMWNGYMKNIRISKSEIDDRFYLKTKYSDRDNWNTPCKTIAQQCAEDNNYEYDVRTTVDGYPITLFYHVHESDPLIFLGKYNWNNDKSTESVYGFKSIPGFDNSHMECWEVINGDYDCNLFKNLSHWDAPLNDPVYSQKGWRYSFEARYPDDSGKATEAARANHALKRVCVWINSTMGASKVDDEPSSPTYNKMIVDNQALMDKFKTGDPGAAEGEGRNGKWDFLDVYKVAAYYVYLMRYGAVDQTVKNAMFTTEDGLHWFYINYDNDTINGVSNDGTLKFGYLIDRQSKDPVDPRFYCYAGHDSVLWNNLEADDEFMSIVKKIDQALFTAGMSYANVIDMFNDKQSAQWSERTHNEDYYYKYINGINREQLEKLQGPRKSHRQWWLSHRFTTYDAINGTDAYLGNRIEIKPPGSAEPGENEYVTVVPATNGQIFGYGYENPVQLGVVGYEGVPIHFDMVERYYIGTTIKFYNAVYFKEIDVSKISQYVNEIDLTRVNSDAFNSELSTFILGDFYSQPNTAMNSISGLGNLKYLENFKMIGYNSIGTVDLRQNNYLKTVDVRNCDSLSSVELPPAAPIETLRFPASISSLDFNNYAYLDTVEVQGNAANINTINVVNCPLFTNSPDFLLGWLDNKTTPDEGCAVYMDNIDWTFGIGENADLHKIGQFILSADPEKTGRVTLMGRATLSEIAESEVAEFMEEFGENVFSPSASFYIDAPESLYIIGKRDLLEGESEQYSLAMIGIEEGGTAFWQLKSVNPQGSSHDETLNRNTGLFETTETGDSETTFVIGCIYTDPSGGIHVAQDITGHVKKRVYPNSSQVNIIGDPELKVGQTNNYAFEYTIEGVTGEMTATWTLTGDLAELPAGDISFISYGMNGCSVTLNNKPSAAVVSGNINLVLNKTNWPGQTITPTPVQIGYVNENVAVSRITNPYAMDVLYGAGLCASPDLMTKVEAMLVTADDLNPGNSFTTSIFYQNSNFRNYCTSFDEFRYFTSVQTIKSGLFYQCKFQSITLPNSVTIIQGTSTNDGAFANCGLLTSIEIPSNVTNIGSCAFANCNSLTSVIFNCDVPNYAFYTTTSQSPFYNCPHITSIILNEGVTTIGDQAFYNRSTGFTSIELPSSLTTIGNSAFYNCSGLTSIELPSSLTTIGNSAFNSCSGLTSIELPSSLTTLGNGAFGYCSGLTSIELPSSLTTIGNSVFLYCSGLTNVIFNCDVPNYAFHTNSSSALFYNCPNIDINSIILNEGVTSIGQYAFQYRTDLTTINLPNSLTTIGNGAFGYCSGLTSIELPSNLTTLGDSVFRDSGLTSIELPDNITELKSDTFRNCTNLVSVTLPENLDRIQSTVFANCTSLTSIEFPSSFTSSSNMAFNGCTALTSIIFNCDVPNYMVYITSTSSPFYNCPNIASIILNEGVTTIGSYAFKDCLQLTHVELPDSLTTIRDNAFANCTGLTSIELSSGLTTFSGSSFVDCTGLTSIIFNCNVPNYALNITNSSSPFYRCSNIDSVTLNEGITSIGTSAFASYSGEFTSSKLPDSITTISTSAFYNCSAEISADLPSSLTSINGSAFYNANLIGDINIPEGLTSIPFQAFYNCNNITGDIIIPEGLTTIGDNAFYECNNIESLHISSTVTSIGSNAFFGMGSVNGLDNITVASENTYYNDGNGSKCLIQTSNNTLILGCNNSVIPNGVVIINTNAFYCCKGLTSVNIPSSVTTINYGAFKYCSELATLTVDPGNTTYASDNCNYIRDNKTNIYGSYIIVGCKNTIFSNDYKGINNYAFCGCTGLTSFSFSKYSGEIGQYAFLDCTELVSVTLTNLSRIGSHGFEGCSKLSNLSLTGVSAIDEFAFQNCTSLTSISIPDSTTSISSSFIDGCSNITSITVNSGNTYYNDGNGSNCIIRTSYKQLVVGCKSTTIPNDSNIVTSISTYAFRNCSGLTSITIPSNITSIEQYAFQNCTGLTTVNLSTGLIAIQRQAFQNCVSLTSIELPSSLVTWGNNPFQDCTGLTSVIFNCNVPNYALVKNNSSSPFYRCSNIESAALNEGVITIGDGAFQNCSWLESVIIPSTVTSIGQSAFYNCPLATMTSKPTTPPTIQSNTLPGVSIVQNIYVPSASVSTYQSASNWNSYSARISAITE